LIIDAIPGDFFMRIVLTGLLLGLLTQTAFACDGQKGKTIFEDTFPDDTGGWAFADNDLVLHAPGAQLYLNASDDGYINSSQNQTFSATQGDYCVQMAFPDNAATLTGPGIGLEFLASDYQNYFMAEVYYDGKISLFRKQDNKWSTVWETNDAPDVKTGPNAFNDIRATVNGTLITVFVNGKQIKAVRAQIPTGDLKFGFFAEYGKTSKDPVIVNIKSVKVTDGQG
jgi:hypothetical protein